MSDRPDLVRHYGGDGFVGRLDDALTKAGLGGLPHRELGFLRLLAPRSNGSLSSRPMVTWHQSSKEHTRSCGRQIDQHGLIFSAFCIKY